MSISKLSGNYTPQGYDVSDTQSLKRPAANQGKTGTASNAASKEGVQVSLSSNSRDLQLINTAVQPVSETATSASAAAPERVESLKQQIATNQYNVDPDAVAASILNDIA